ncbi:MAG: NAD(P)H-binding protein [Chloroflexi bacterium]|nr:NAD(P)H-binding protein [Chloroflexota bacterium]
MRRVFVAGGTGFLGHHAIQEFLAHGWEVTALGLPPAPPRDMYPATVKVVMQSLDTATNGDLLSLLRGHEVLVFAAGADDRFPVQRPAYPFFRHGNVETPERLLRLAKEAGMKRAVVLGSYFAHFNRLWPEMRLAERHPYIRSRMEQEGAVTSIPGLDGMVLELPYIFGRLPVPGWKPLWTPLVKYLRSSRTILYMKGGTACISAKTVGRAILAAVERGEAGKCYPIGQENLTWTQMLTRLAAADRREVRVKALPTGLVKAGMYGLWFAHWLQGKEHGLDPRFYAVLQTAETYLDAAPSQQALGYEPANLDEAFRETVEAC